MTAPSETTRTVGILPVEDGLASIEAIDTPETNGLIAINERLEAAEEHDKKNSLAYFLGDQMGDLVYKYGQPDFKVVSWKYGVHQFTEGEHRIPSVNIPTESGDVEVWLSAYFSFPDDYRSSVTSARDLFIHFKLNDQESLYGIKDRTPFDKRSDISSRVYEDLPTLKELKLLKKIMPTVIKAYEKSDHPKTPQMPNPDHY